MLESASESEPVFHVVTDSSHARLCTQGPAGWGDWNLLLAVMVLLNAISVFFYFFYYILILQSPQLPYIYISVGEVECVAFILRLDGDISFKVKTCFISTGYGINGQRSVYLCLFDGVLTLYCAHTHLLLPLPNPERQRKDPLVKLLAPTRDNIYSAFILPCLRNPVLASADTGLPPRQA